MQAVHSNLSIRRAGVSTPAYFINATTTASRHRRKHNAQHHFNFNTTLRRQPHNRTGMQRTAVLSHRLYVRFERQPSMPTGLHHGVPMTQEGSHDDGSGKSLFATIAHRYVDQMLHTKLFCAECQAIRQVKGVDGAKFTLVMDCGHKRQRGIDAI